MRNVSAYVPPATTAKSGAVKPDGTVITVDGDGAITVPKATDSSLGVMKPDGISIVIDGAGTISTSGMSFSGAWSGTTAYIEGDVVTYEGIAYLCIESVPVEGTPVCVQSAAAANAASLAFTTNVTAGNLIIVYVGAATLDASISAPTDTLGTVYTLLATNGGGSYDQLGAIYYGVAPSSGPCTVSFAHFGTPLIAIAEFSSVSDIVDVDTTGIGSISSVSLTTAFADMIIGGVITGNASTFTGSSGVTVAAQAESVGLTVSIALGYMTAATPGAHTFGLTASGGTGGPVFVVGAFRSGVLTPAADTEHWLSLGFIEPSGAANEVLATPNGSSGGASLRALVSADLPIATSSARGAVKPDGTTVDVDVSGVISVPTATTSQLGLVKPDGTTIDISAGIVSVPVMVGDSGSGGAKGLVPAPAAGDAAAGKVLKADGTWYTPPSSLSNPMTAAGDIIVGGAAGAPARLAKSTDGDVLTLVSGSPAWATPSGGGGGSVPAAVSSWVQWPPSSANAMDDEFTSGSLDPKWTVNNSGSGGYTPGVNSALVVSTGADLAFVQTKPSTPCEFILHQYMANGMESDNPCAGLCFGDGTKFVAVVFGYIGGVLKDSAWYFDNISTFDSNHGNFTYGFFRPDHYLKLKDDGTNFIMSSSLDGRQWTVMFTLSRTAFLSAGGNVVGILCAGGIVSGGSNPVVRSFDFFRRTL